MHLKLKLLCALIQIVHFSDNALIASSEVEVFLFIK